MALTCKVCKAEVPPEQVDTAARLARCAVCGAVFDIEGAVAGAARPGRRERPAIAPPKGVKIEDYGETFRITCGWFGCAAIPMAIFCVIWDGFLIFWYASAIKSGNAVMLLFPIIHVTVGVCLTYSTLASFLNTTAIEVTFDRLTVRHGPLPWLGNLDLPTLEVAQLYCKQKTHRGKNSVSYTYEVHAQLSSGDDKKLMSGLHDASQALYIEQEMERRMGIQNRRVAGDYR